MPTKVTNVVVAGLGGQGVIKASDILAEVFVRAGYDVKKSELHGMSQRGGSVYSDVRFGAEVRSPMVPAGQADFLVVMAPDQVENNRHRLKPAGVLLAPDRIDERRLASRKNLNVALLGLLSTHLDVAPEHWRAALEANLPEKIRAQNLAAFELGRSA